MSGEPKPVSPPTPRTLAQDDYLTEGGAGVRRPNIIARLGKMFTGERVPGGRGHIETTASYYRDGRAINVRDRRAKRMDMARRRAR